ncbi:MAG: ATP-binding protein [Chloroflexia bacterium]
MKQFAALPFRPDPRPAWYNRLRYLAAALGVTVATGVLWLAQPVLSLGSVYLIYLVIVVAVAVGWGLRQGVLASGLAFLCANYFFHPPVFTFDIAQPQDVLALVIFLGIATLTSQLVASLQREAQEARRSQQVTATLYELSQTINRQHNLASLLQEVTVQLCNVLNLESIIISIVDPGGLGRVTTHSGSSPLAENNADTNVVRLPLTAGVHSIGNLLMKLPAGRRPFDLEERRIVEAFRDQLQMAIERAQLQQTAIQIEVLRRTDSLRLALLSAVAHDLRTPLTSIKASATSLLNMKINWSEEDESAFLGAIVGEADHINSLVSNLLDSARIEEGRLSPHKELHSISDVIETVLERLTPRLKGHPLQTEIEPDLPFIPMDVVEIDEVITNLLENAIKYTPPGTPIHIRAKQQGDAIKIEVADEGPGIPPQHLQYIFDRFYRVAKGGAGPTGTGLGLSIVKGIVEAHGGEVQVSNRLGGGAMFSFTLPLQTSNRSEQPTAVERVNGASVPS